MECSLTTIWASRTQSHTTNNISAYVYVKTLQTFQACKTMTQEKTWANKLINFSFFLYTKTVLSRYSYCICLCLVSIVLLLRCFIGVRRGGGNNLRGGPTYPLPPPPPPPLIHPPTLIHPTHFLQFLCEKGKNHKRTKLKGKIIINVTLI